MANISNHNGKRFRVDPVRTLVYVVLIGYAIISVLPLYVMISSSMMKLGEVNTGQFVPGNLGDMVSNCLLYTNDTYVDENGDEVTRNRLVVDITEEAAEAAGQGVRATPQNTISRSEHFRLPFLTNYCSTWADAKMGEYIFNTIQIVAITLVGLTLFTPLAAYAFARMEFPGRNVIFGLMLATLMVPEMVTNLPNFLIVKELGDLFGSGGLGWCGEATNCWMNNWPALTIPFMVTPFAIFLMRQQFATIPNELWDAARMDGASHFRFLVQVVVPLSRPVFLVVILFAFIGSWNALAWPILVTSGDTWRPISYGLQSFIQEGGTFAQLRMAGAVIASLPVLILYAFTQRYFVEGLSTSGLKG
ncbi:MAG: carbohydrate ABC transporter permease [Anaerolineales bacterium]|nr:carbohydrate ABC transporter permease [Anaerolineales bacterium]MCB0029211.1 carbohydrate ABC transporter permease [Anaerolineales bacterium]MCB8959558.1 carbohydrate ABC transporter permease [Ardenticatenales bacterium]